jgi:hypothetical protein
MLRQYIQEETKCTPIILALMVQGPLFIPKVTHKQYYFTSPLSPFAYYTCFRSLAPAHNTGAKCFDMLKPNRDANHRIVVTAMGARRSSVW